jgi:acyl-CoA synthetase (AMP-forming)/AMP-acid ligase II
MKMLPPEPCSLWSALSAGGHLSSRWLRDRDASVCLDALTDGSTLGSRLEELYGRCVLVATKDQLSTALGLVELDGVARRLVLCPLGLSPADFSSIIASADVDAIIGNGDNGYAGGSRIKRLVLSPRVMYFGGNRRPSLRSEWILLTSGTTGAPKLVRHTLASLTDAMTGTLGRDAVWATFYDIRRYGGLQILLRALLGGGSMVLSDTDEPVTELLIRAGEAGVTHISGTPSHWRRALMSPSARHIQPRYVRLSGEIADQVILDRLRSVYRDADIAHAFASTEAGVAFDVGDGSAGFPPDLIGRQDNGVETRIKEGSLHIKSGRTAIGYLGGTTEQLRDEEGYVDTGDLVQLRNGRYYFMGRRGGIINVGGQKVHPEEIEAVINGHPSVRMSLVKMRKSPVTGAIVVADVVINAEDQRDGGLVLRQEALKREILETCRRSLARYKIPATIRLVPALEVAPSGKLMRHYA